MEMMTTRENGEVRHREECLHFAHCVFDACTLCLTYSTLHVITDEATAMMEQAKADVATMVITPFKTLQSFVGLSFGELDQAVPHNLNPFPQEFPAHARSKNEATEGAKEHGKKIADSEDGKMVEAAVTVISVVATEEERKKQKAQEEEEARIALERRRQIKEDCRQLEVWFCKRHKT